MLPNVIVFDAFGASETGYQGASAGADAQGRPKFMFGEHTIVIDDDGNPTDARRRGGRPARPRGHMPLGYYKDEEKTAETFPVIDGERWVVPGDIAVVEADGTITLLGRGSVCINSGGEKIYPEEVESWRSRATRTCSTRSSSACPTSAGASASPPSWSPARAPSADRGGAARLRHASTIAGYKLPKELCFVDEMVRSPSGKADYRWAKSVALDAGRRLPEPTGVPDVAPR